MIYFKLCYANIPHIFCQTCAVQIRNNKIEMPSFLCMWFALSELSAELIPSLLIGIPLLYFFLEHFLYYIDINLTIFFFCFCFQTQSGTTKTFKECPTYFVSPLLFRHCPLTNLRLWFAAAIDIKSCMLCCSLTPKGAMACS